MKKQFSNKEGRMEEIKCPICSDKNIKHIDNVKLIGSDYRRPLYKCNKSGEFFWGDSGDKALFLSYYCKTRREERGKCNEKILKFFEYQEIQSLQKVKELDLICSECPKIKIS